MRDEIRRMLAEEQGSRPDGATFVAIDFETFYRSERLARREGKPPCSADTQGSWAYCQHPEWEAYLVSIYAPDVQYVGDPRRAPWHKLYHRTWLSHNAGFDRHVYERLVEQEIVLPVDYKEWHCTADLAVYSKLPRALKDASFHAFGITLDKTVRGNMDGVRWASVPPDERQRVLDYALDDAAICWLLWARYSSRWPEIERWGSLHTREIEFRGIPVDRATVDQDIAVLEAALWVAQKHIPWVDTEDENGRPIALRSKAALDRECMRCGVTPPRTTAQKSKEFLEWVDEFGEKVPAVLELGRCRRIDRALSVYRALKARIRPDGRAALGLKYLGAAKTGRWSGANKFNLQNLMKAPLMFDADYGWSDAIDGAEHIVDVRSCITAGPGRKLIIADLAQIEPRILNWIVGNAQFLELCAQGMSPYEAHARSSMGWTGGNLKKEAPAIYALAKARVLALGYGAGWHKFIEMARGYLGSEAQFLEIFAAKPTQRQVDDFLGYLAWQKQRFNHAMSDKMLAEWATLDEQTQSIWVNAWLQVTEFRQSNDKIRALWTRLDSELISSSNDGGVHETELPSGRVLTYYDVSRAQGSKARPNDRNAPPSRIYGGLMVENLTQACARDVFLAGIRNLEDAGYRVIFHVHDEVVVEADASASRADVVRLLTTMPAWAKSLPVAAEAEETDCYKK